MVRTQKHTQFPGINFITFSNGELWVFIGLKVSLEILKVHSSVFNLKTNLNHI